MKEKDEKMSEFVRLVLPTDEKQLAEIKSKVYWAALMEPYSTFEVP